MELFGATVKEILLEDLERERDKRRQAAGEEDEEEEEEAAVVGLWRELR